MRVGMRTHTHTCVHADKVFYLGYEFLKTQDVLGGHEMFHPEEKFFKLRK